MPASYLILTDMTPRAKIRTKLREWLRRYIPAEILGTIGAVVAATIVYSHSHSYLAAAGAGWVGEGIGFFGYFITAELISNSKTYRHHRFIKRVALAAGASSTNLLIEFAPAEVIDNLIIRPFAMYITPQYIHPYMLGFLVGKFAADIVFYAIAAAGYEARKRWVRK